MAGAAVSIVPVYRVELVRDGSTRYPARHFGKASEVFAFASSLMGSLDRESMWCITVDSKNKVIGVNMVSLGSLSTSVVHPRECFKVAVIQNAAAVIFFHNHPSGDPAPSREDRLCTERLVKAGQILGIRVLDHVVIGASDYFSFADAGWLQGGDGNVEE